MAAGLMLGLYGVRPRGVSAVTLKCPVNGGPTDDGKVDGSHFYKKLVKQIKKIIFFLLHS